MPWSGLAAIELEAPGERQQVTSIVPAAIPCHAHSPSSRRRAAGSSKAPIPSRLSSRASSPSGVEDSGRAVWVGVRGPSRSLAGLERGQRAACRDLLLAIRAAIHPGNPRLRNPSEGSGSLGGQRVCTILDVQARLARPRGFHDWDEPCGDATRRVNSSRIRRILGDSGFPSRGSGKKIDTHRRAC